METMNGTHTSSGPAQWWRSPPLRLYVAAFVGSVITSLIASYHVPISSDQASILLEADAFRHGNVLLHGWVLPADNFLFTSIPIYAIAISLFGISNTVFHVLPPLFFGILTALMVWHARYEENTVPKRRTVTILLLLLILFPSCAGLYPGITIVFIEHVATLIGILLSWLLLRLMRGGRSSRSRALLTAGAGVILGLTTASDPFAVFLFGLPFLLMIGHDAILKAHPPLRIREGCTVICALIAGLALPVAAHHLGGFSTEQPLAHFAALSSVPLRAGRFITYLFMVSGSPFWGGSIRSITTLVALAHGILLLGIVIAVVAASAAWLRSRSTSETATLLSLGCGITTLALLASQQLQQGTERYVLLVLVLSLPVAASYGASWLLSRSLSSWVLPAVLVLTGMTMLAGYAPAVHRSHTAATAAAAFLTAHHLSSGFSDYWDAAAVTVASRDTVTITPVFAFGSTPRIVPQTFLADSAWLRKPGASGTWFVLVNPQETGYGITPAVLEHSFGAPAATYHVNSLLIEVWHRNLPGIISRSYADALSHGPVPPLPSAA